MTMLFVSDESLHGKELIRDGRLARIFRGKFGGTGEDVIVHEMSFMGFQSADLFQFLQVLLTLSVNRYRGFLPILGWTCDVASFSVVYRAENGIRPVEVEKLDDDGALRVKRCVSECLFVLHSLNLAHLRVKLSSVFVNNAGEFFFGCVSPRGVVDIEEEDAMLPFYEQPNWSRDLYMFGLLMVELQTKQSQHAILEQIWRFEHPVTDNEIASELLHFNIDERPKAEHLVQAFGGELQTAELVPLDVVQHFVLEDTSVFSLIVRGYLAAEHKEFEHAMEIYKSISENVIAANNLAKFTLVFDKSEATIRQATEMFARDGDKGYAIAQFNAGYAYVRGVGIEQNTELGRDYIRKAADQGYIEAMCVFAMEARLFDLTISAHYLRWAARKTEPKAIHMYGLACEQNIGYPKDTAIDYFRMGTECGYMKPMNNLATRCGDIHMANTLWRRAAEMGSEHGAYNLAVSYKLGRGIEQDDVQAARWMKMASDLQYSPAMFDYAIMLRDGIGCEKDEEAAEKLCELAGTKKLRDFTMRDQLMRVTEENIATAPKGE